MNKKNFKSSSIVTRRRHEVSHTSLKKSQQLARHLEDVEVELLERRQSRFLQSYFAYFMLESKLESYPWIILLQIINQSWTNID